LRDFAGLPWGSLDAYIYLLYAIRGITPDTLTNSQVRKGFKGWIEVSNRFNSKPKSRISKFTGVWRTIVDVMLYAPNFTEGTFIACSVGVLYYVASKLIPYFFNRD